MARLVFFSGTMDCGKSTLALQMAHNRASAGQRGLLFTRDDRAGDSVLSSRLGLQSEALEVTDDTDFWDIVASTRTHGGTVDFVIADEAQFFTPRQIEQLANVVDEMNVDVFAFGITSDFRTRLFPGSARLIELADRVEVLQVEALCWCGARATHNARTVRGVMVTEGEQVVVGNVDDAAPTVASADDADVGYETLCRRHHMRRMTRVSAQMLAASDQPLPFDPPVCRAIQR
ncbi:thymidine kinase [Spelaeicoccus albus]|uniref:Thymidine kinase n=1 Tax=Spelaeicoccus albus TaxID=1280376 RepID=A0A7Z0D2Z4_9MICO|nr:thymidine kinase [Spelaeicoccus albus]NYI67919.1 thymidine kinase [Spelaeicoccus albus]